MTDESVADLQQTNNEEAPLTKESSILKILQSVDARRSQNALQKTKINEKFSPLLVNAPKKRKHFSTTETDENYHPPTPQTKPSLEKSPVAHKHLYNIEGICTICGDMSKEFIFPSSTGLVACKTQSEELLDRSVFYSFPPVQQDRLVKFAAVINEETNLFSLGRNTETRVLSVIDARINNRIDRLPEHLSIVGAERRRKFRLMLHDSVAVLAWCGRLCAAEADAAWRCQPAPIAAAACGALAENTTMNERAVWEEVGRKVESVLTIFNILIHSDSTNNAQERAAIGILLCLRLKGFRCPCTRITNTLKTVYNRTFTVSVKHIRSQCKIGLDNLIEILKKRNKGYTKFQIQFLPLAEKDLWKLIEELSAEEKEKELSRKTLPEYIRSFTLYYASKKKNQPTEQPETAASDSNRTNRTESFERSLTNDDQLDAPANATRRTESLIQQEGQTATERNQTQSVQIAKPLASNATDNGVGTFQPNHDINNQATQITESSCSTEQYVDDNAEIEKLLREDNTIDQMLLPPNEQLLKAKVMAETFNQKKRKVGKKASKRISVQKSAPKEIPKISFSNEQLDSAKAKILDLYDSFDL